ncbi:MAG: rRNA maturation RNase YbeY [Xanthobacteraceae bacterium]|nr:rRNA maturation RNase YbeY [Xanthobacteraceae bacterium]
MRASRNRAEPIKLEIVVRSKLWQRQRTAQSIVRKAIFAAAKAASTAPAELAIVLSHDSAIKALNRDWRGKNTATNVLSFPAARATPSPNGGKPGKKAPGKSRPPTPYIGDIVIAYQTTAREAEAEGKPFGHHLAHLAVHGFLHLLGYDHENDRDAETMERLERRILKHLAVPDPYAPRPAAN